MADDETYRDLSSAPLPGDALPLAPLAPRPPAPWPVLPAALSRLKAWMVPLSLQTASHLTFAPPKATPPCRSTALSAPRRSSRSSAPDRPLKTRTSVPRAEVVVTSAPEGEHVSVERAVVCAMTICDRAGGRVAEVEDEAWAADGAGWTCRRWTCPAWRPGIASKDEPGADAMAMRPGSSGIGKSSRASASRRDGRRQRHTPSGLSTVGHSAMRRSTRDCEETVAVVARSLPLMLEPLGKPEVATAAPAPSGADVAVAASSISKRTTRRRKTTASRPDRLSSPSTRSLYARGRPTYNEGGSRARGRKVEARARRARAQQASKEAEMVSSWRCHPRLA
jgi:hypothetical protein